jgi:hypothetical protein
MYRMFDFIAWLNRRTGKGGRPAPGRCVPSRRIRLGIEALEERAVPAGVVASYAVTQDWGSGFQAQVRLDNQQTVNVPNWKLDFDFAPSITSIWDAQVVSHVGTHYVVTNAGWNSTLAAGGAVSFGFVANPGHPTAAPANYLLNGSPLDGPPPALPTLSLGDVSVAEGNSGTTNAVFPVTLSAASTSPVTVAFTTANGTAQAGSDYQTVTGTLTFAPGETAKTIAVPVLGDTLVEPDETFTVALTNPSAATLARGQATGTIRNDDVPPPTGNFLFQVVSDWGSGFTGQVTIRNSTTTPVAGWSLGFDFAGQITAIWDGQVASHVGNHYVVTNAGWNATIPAGGTASFGFNGSPGNGVASPTNFVLGGNAGLTNHNPTPSNDSAYAYANEATRINVLANDTDPDGDPLTVSAATQGQNGSVAVNADRTLTYTPRTGFTGLDSFTYAVSDGKGGTATATVAVTVADSSASWPTHTFAPYVDMTLYPMYDLVSAARDQGLHYFTLAFVVADSQNQPSWGGYSAYEVNGGAFDQQLQSQIAGVRALGGDVMVSFGGANGQELAQVITDPRALQAAYQQVVDAYHLTHLDFDIEGGAVADHASIDRRSQALAALQHAAAAAGRPLQVWLTLPVLPTGLTADGLYVVQSALRYGVNLAGVNGMAMDYGDGAAPNPQGHMGDYAIQMATSLFNQLQSLFGSTKTAAQLWSMVGVTPMIGLNDVTTEVFDQQEARELLPFAQQKGIGRLSIWSLNRDRQNPNGALPYVEPFSSSLVQQPFEFTQIFRTFDD